ncbi:MAG TPA: hypothetical protein VMT30_06880 [Candidatus Saccharimonadia bacterium]|nr:hypothetical protein [Candidatus Saccharimonadia bacterium]
MRRLFGILALIGIIVYVVPHASNGGPGATQTGRRGIVTSQARIDYSKVTSRLTELKLGPLVTSQSSGAQRQVATTKLLASGLVTAVKYDQRIRCYPLDDLSQRAAKMYWGLVQFLQVIVTAGFVVGVSCVNTGHDRDGALHPLWRAMDINYVNGRRVNTRLDQVWRFARWVMGLNTADLPTEVGSDSDFIDHSRMKKAGRGPFIVDPAHFHFGYRL